MMESPIYQQIYEALDAATLENGYPHEYECKAADIVLEIHEWSGIEGFDPENPSHVQAGCAAVATWRSDNPKGVQA